MLVTTRQKHQLNPPPLALTLNGSTIFWHAHTNMVSKSLSKNLHLLSQIKQFTNEDARKLFCNAYILPHINYCSTVWDSCSDASLEQINSQHRRAARLVIDSDENTNTDEKMKLLGMLPLRQQFLYNKLILMRKVTLGKAPEYILNLIKDNDSPYETRGNPIYYPKPRIDFCKASFTFSGPHAWNEIPKQIQSISSLSTFKKRVHKHLFES